MNSGGNERMIKYEGDMPVYVGDTFEIALVRYSDPERKNAARNAARYLGKKDIDNIRRPLSIVRQGHVPAIFRGEMAEFEFRDVSKEVYDHIITYSTANMRVAGGNRALRSDGYVIASDKMKNPENVDHRINQSMEQYFHLLDDGETPQVARGAMPVNAKMNIFVYQFNFVTLAQSVFRQRIWEKGAQGNTAKVVQGMYELVHHMDAELWDTFNEWYGLPPAEWAEVRRKIQKEKMTVQGLIDALEASMKGELKDRRGKDLPSCEAGEQVFDVLRRIYGEQKSMW